MLVKFIRLAAQGVRLPRLHYQVQGREEMESLHCAWQVWCGALTWCPRCGPPGGMSSARRGRSSRKLPRASRGKPWRPGGGRVVAVFARGFPALMTLHRQTSRTGDVVRPTTAESCRRAAANLLFAWSQLLPFFV